MTLQLCIAQGAAAKDMNSRDRRLVKTVQRSIFFLFFASLSWTRNATSCPPIPHQKVQGKFGQLLCPTPRHYRSVLPAHAKRRPTVLRSGQPRLLTSKISKAGSASALLTVLDSAVDHQDFNEFHAGAAFCRLARFKQMGRLKQERLSSGIVVRLQDRLLSLISQGGLEARGAANIFWAVAVLAMPSTQQVLASLVKVVANTSVRMKPQELANCIWAVASLKQHPVALQALPDLLSNLPRKIPGMKPQEVCNCLWAAAHLHAAAPKILEPVSDMVLHLARQTDRLGAQDLSNCLWTAVHLREASHDILKAIPGMVAQVPRVAAAMIPQHLANCLWSCAYLQDAAPEVLQIVPEIVQQLPGKVSQMNSQELSNCVWAAANLKDTSPEVLPALSELAEGVSRAAVSDELLPQHVSNYLWATAHLHNSSKEMLNALPAIASLLPSTVGGMNAQEVANCFWATAQLQEVAPCMLRAVPCAARRLAETVNLMKPQELSSCFLASARLEGVAPEVLICTPLLAHLSSHVWPQCLRHGVEMLIALRPPKQRRRKKRVA